MPRNGSGVYSPPAGTTASPDTTIESAKYNALVSDLTADANAARPVTAGGTGRTAARLEDGTWRFENTADPAKLLAFDLSGLTTGTTLTLKVPNGQMYHGQCRLALDGSDLRLKPFNGNLLTIGGYSFSIPDVGITLAPTSLAANTVYYIYASGGSTIVLEASTTAPVFVNGLKVKTGDSSRTLVGMARTSAAVAWQDNCISYFNRRPIARNGFFTADRTSSATSFTEINSEIAISFLCWDDDAVEFSFSGAVSGSPAGIGVKTAIAVDGALKDGAARSILGTTDLTTHAGTMRTVLSAGYHTTTLFGIVSSGAATWRTSSNAVGDRFSLSGIIQG